MLPDIIGSLEYCAEPLQRDLVERRPTDVLLRLLKSGSADEIAASPGNMKFHSMAWKFGAGFSKANELCKSQRIDKIIKLISLQDPPGRFLLEVEDESDAALHGSGDIEPTLDAQATKTSTRYHVAPQLQVKETIRRLLVEIKRFSPPAASLSVAEQALIYSQLVAAARNQKKRQSSQLKDSPGNDFPILDTRTRPKKPRVKVATLVSPEKRNQAANESSWKPQGMDKSKERLAPKVMQTTKVKPQRHNKQLQQNMPVEAVLENYNYDQWSELICEAKAYLSLQLNYR
ncbi:hypothetical protein MPSEU_000549700 [Mayamaea pseudoterrestris]|nr:hypothetical protein MPSEU_000549700 [Mayamaea pseudoterrestris]